MSRRFPSGAAALALMLAASAFATDNPKDAKKEAATVMPAFKVQETPIDNFGLQLTGFLNSTTRKVQRLFITAVTPNSEADHSDLKAGDEIVSINGRSIESLNSTLAKGDPLYGYFINRPPGERIDLGIVTRVQRDVSLHAVHILNLPTP